MVSIKGYCPMKTYLEQLEQLEQLELEDSPQRKKPLCPFSSPRPLPQKCLPLSYPDSIPRPSRSPAGWRQGDRNGTQGRTKA